MLVRRTNGRPLSRLREEMDHLFENFMGDAPFTGSFGLRTFPALNIWEDENNLFVEAELPGMKMNDIEVLVAGKELTIKGERKARPEPKASLHRQERQGGVFNRIVQLPLDVNPDAITAELRDGVLLITLPKAEEVRPRKIAVQGTSK